MLVSKILGGVSIFLLLALMVAGYHIRNLTGKNETLTNWQNGVMTALKLESDNPKLTKELAVTQIHALGGALKEKTAAIETQNDSIAQLGRERDQALDRARQVAVVRREVIQRSQTLAKELESESTTPVEKQEIEAEIRRVQDLGYKAGL